MAKRVVTARVETDLIDAVTARVAERGESVTDVIVRAFREYLDSPGAPPVPKGGRVCPHPKARVFKGLCMACGKAVP